jgi:hypothetical protein
MKPDLSMLIFVGGLLHFCILIAGALVPQVLNWRSELQKLHPMSRHIIWVHGLFIILTIVAFGLVGTTQAPVLASSSGLARSVCGFIALFWLVRLVIQFTLFDPGRLLSKWWLRLGYHGLTVVFIYFACTFGWAAIRPA